jgi:hypothetical protein
MSIFFISFLIKNKYAHTLTYVIIDEILIYDLKYLKIYIKYLLKSHSLDIDYTIGIYLLNKLKT